MTTNIYYRHGQLAPTVTVTDLRRYPGRVWKLADRRGAVGISRDGETLAVYLSLDRFVSLLFGIPTRRPRKKQKTRGTARRKR